MSHLQKWRRWCGRIESDILIPYKFDKLIAEEYFQVIKPVLDSGAPPDFHNWCTANYGFSIAMVVRKLSDDDSRVYSIRKLVGDIAENHRAIKKQSYIRRHPAHFRSLAKDNWNKCVSPTKDFLPKAIPLQHIEEIKDSTKRVNSITNNFLAHTGRVKNKKYTVEFDEMYGVVRRLISIGYFYSDLVGGNNIPDDDSNVVITRDWQNIFKESWIK